MSVEVRLVDALKSNDSKKLEVIFKEIYDANYKLVYFCATHYLKIKEDIEEIVNDVFINFYNHLDNIKIEGNIKYYLTKSTKNACINYLKKKERKEVSIDEKILEKKTFIQYEYKDNSFINKIEKMLNEEEFNIVFEHVVLGVSLKEIALNLKVSPNTIKSKYRRALKKLNKQFGGNYHE